VTLVSIISALGFTCVLWIFGVEVGTVLGVAVRTPTNAHLGRAIRRLRSARRLSIESLAVASDMHPTYLSAIERGIRNPTWAKLCDLAQALDIPVSALARAAEAETYGAAYTLNTEPAV
jgi:DNA-binding XRE family transcriptional regulator